VTAATAPADVTNLAEIFKLMKFKPIVQKKKVDSDTTLTLVEKNGKIETTAEMKTNKQIEIEKIMSEYVTKGIQPKVLKIKGGNFFMGTNQQFLPQDREGPEREVTVKDFEMDAYEVSVGQFAEFVAKTSYVSEAENFTWSFVLDRMLPIELVENAKGYAGGVPWWLGIEGADWLHPEGLPSFVLNTYPTYDPLTPSSTSALPSSSSVLPDLTDPLAQDNDGNRVDTLSDTRLNHPVVHISYNDAVAYCQWREMRLPSEEEWEYAARGGKERRLYSWGNVLLPGGKHMTNIWQGDFPNTNTVDDGWIGTSPVNSFPRNGYDLYNMAGNVWEWTSTWSDINPGDRIKKGGSYMCHHSYCYRYRVASRSGNTPDSSAANLGFRCAKSV